MHIIEWSGWTNAKLIYIKYPRSQAFEISENLTHPRTIYASITIDNITKIPELSNGIEVPIYWKDFNEW